MKLRYVTDAGCHPQAYYRDVLCKMKHPLTGRRLKWSWCVDFFHACEYVSKLAASLFGTGSEAAQRWAQEQRHTLRHKQDGIKTVRHNRNGEAGSRELKRTSLRR